MFVKSGDRRTQMIFFTRNRERTIFFSTHLLDDVERVSFFLNTAGGTQ